MSASSVKGITAHEVAADLNALMELDETSIANLLLHEVQVPSDFLGEEDEGLNVRVRRQLGSESYSLRVIDLLCYLFHERGKLTLVCDGSKPVGNRFVVRVPRS